MREIKFRAWDQQKSIYGEVSLLEHYDEYRAKENYGHKGRVTLWNPRNEADCGSWGRWIELVDLEQYTGLKDKNGREIYEGDVLEEPGVSYEVGSGGEVNPPTRSVVDWARSQSGGYRDVTIIGNIHENPELMK